MTLLLVIHMMTYECPYDGDDDNYIYEFCCGGVDKDLYSNVYSDYHDTPSTLRSMKIKM